MADMTRKEFVQAGMATRGWEFMPTGPNEWEWLKFDGEKVVSRQGDVEWDRDLETVVFSADQNFK